MKPEEIIREKEGKKMNVETEQKKKELETQEKVMIFYNLNGFVRGKYEWFC